MLTRIAEMLQKKISEERGADGAPLNRYRSVMPPGGKRREREVRASIRDILSVLHGELSDDPD
jgi:hypothetical protein